MKKIIIVSSACLICMIGNVNAVENNLTVCCSDEKLIIKGSGDIAENELMPCNQCEKSLVARLLILIHKLI